jgi:hypothetical protein
MSEGLRQQLDAVDLSLRYYRLAELAKKSLSDVLHITLREPEDCVQLLAETLKHYIAETDKKKNDLLHPAAPKRSISNNGP